MPTLYLSKGLPGCGKTTFARAFIESRPDDVIVRANRDEIRFMLYGTYWGPPIDEDIVTLVQYTIIDAALRAGHDVYVDDTNLSPFVQRNLYNAADAVPNTDVVWHDHTDVSLSTCIERDAARAAAGERSTGAEVIRNMWEKYLK